MSTTLLFFLPADGLFEEGESALSPAAFAESDASGPEKERRLSMPSLGPVGLSSVVVDVDDVILFSSSFFFHFLGTLLTALDHGQGVNDVAKLLLFLCEMFSLVFRHKT